jgi:hypothetical protein
MMLYQQGLTYVAHCFSRTLQIHSSRRHVACYEWFEVEHYDSVY